MVCQACGNTVAGPGTFCPAIPAGTALGAYTLWALAPSASGFEYEAIADRT